MITNTVILDRVQAYTLALEANYIERGYARNDYSWALENSGQKYNRIVQTSGGSRSVHAFVGNDGLVYKSAGWKTPELKSGARFDLLNEESFANLLANANWSGGNLYRGVKGQLPKGYTVADRPAVEVLAVVQALTGDKPSWADAVQAKVDAKREVARNRPHAKSRKSA